MIPPPFHMLPSDQFGHVAAKRGAVLFREGEPTDGMYLCLTSAVRMERVCPNGEAVAIHTVEGGQSFAEASIFAQTYHCSATVIADGDILRIPKATVLAGFADPAFSIAYNRIMSRQVQHYRQIIEIISIRSATDRVYAAMVAGLLETSVVNLSQRIALTHEATYRALRYLVAQGRLEKPCRGQYRLPSSGKGAGEAKFG